MKIYKCIVCNYIYDEANEEKLFEELSDDWVCPVCGSPKRIFVLLSEGEREVPENESTVADILVNQMAAWGVEYVFSIPGTSSLGIVDAVRKVEKLKYVQVRHEQTAAFMASAYGKLTGHVAACLTIAGPGATNLATGLYDAKMDSSPVLAITGQVKRQLIGPGSFQEIDQYSFFEPICVFNEVLMSKEQTTTLCTLAIKQALVHRGVAHLTVPNDIQKQTYTTKILPVEGRIPNMNINPSEYLVKEAALVIDQATRPVIIVGFGAKNQGEKLIKLARKIDAPIVSTYRGRGIIDEDDELYIGGHGDIGSTTAAQLVDEADLLIVIGSSFSDKTQIPEKKTIQVDIDPMSLGRRFPVDKALMGNSADIIARLTKYVQKIDKPEYLSRIKKLKQEWLGVLEKEIDSSATPIRPSYIIKVLNDNISGDAVISVDVGENAWWFGRNFRMKKDQEVILSGSLASMGFGLPGALTAQLVYPDRQVICFTGDGGFSMVMADFMTAVKYGLPIKVFLLNNGQLGMIMQEQKVENYPNWQTELHNCDFAEYARSCGGVGIKVNKAEELEDAVKKALASDKPVIIDINTDPRRFVSVTPDEEAGGLPGIQAMPNGPFIVDNLKSLKNSRGDNIPVMPTLSLCRCGESKNKPFCDETHTKIGFHDDKEEDRVPDKLDTYPGNKITIHDNRGVCSHAGFCTDNSPKVFDSSHEPWIDPDADDADNTGNTIRMCPSGALSYTRDGILYKDQDRDPSVMVSKDGPYRITGFIGFQDAKGNKPESQEHYTLCRCGHSKNMPFCSGQHWWVNFKDDKN